MKTKEHLPGIPVCECDECNADRSPLDWLYFWWPSHRTLLPGDETAPKCRYVYFALCDQANAVKVGLAWNPYSRVRDLAAANPLPLRLVAFMEADSSNGAADLEKLCHQAFEPWRIRGEWFWHEGEVKEFVGHLVEVCR